MERFILNHGDASVWYGTFSHFDKLSLQHGVSTRMGGVSNQPFHSLNLALHTGDEETHVIRNRKLFCQTLGAKPEDIVTAEQTHGDQIVVVNKEHLGKGALKYSEAIADTDALVTNIPGIPLMLFFADCVPVLLFDPVKRVIGIAHAGWKGTVAGIAQKTILTMQKQFGTNPNDCLAGIAPSIGPCCYEVDERLINQFKKQEPSAEQLFQQHGDKIHLDLWQANRLQLEQSGLKLSNIVVSSVCTACNNELFFSYRAEHGNTGRIAAMIVL